MRTSFFEHQGSRVAGLGISEGDYSEDSESPYEETYADGPYWVVPNYSRKAWAERCGPVIIVQSAKKVQS